MAFIELFDEHTTKYALPHIKQKPFKQRRHHLRPLCSFKAGKECRMGLRDKNVKQRQEKEENWLYFPLGKHYATSDAVFIPAVLSQTIATSQSARGNLDSYCKIILSKASHPTLTSSSGSPLSISFKLYTTTSVPGKEKTSDLECIVARQNNQESSQSLPFGPILLNCSNNCSSFL